MPHMATAARYSMIEARLGIRGPGLRWHALHASWHFVRWRHIRSSIGK